MAIEQLKTGPATRFWLIFIPDVFLLYFALVMSLWIRYGGVSGDSLAIHLKAFSLLFIVWFAVLFGHGLFEVSVFRRYTYLIFGLASAMAVNSVIAVGYFYLQPNLILTPRRVLLILIVLTFVFLVAWRLLLKYLLQSRLTQGVYLFSGDYDMDELSGVITSHAYLGYQLLGTINSDSVNELQLERNSLVVLPDTVKHDDEVLARLYALREKGMIFFNYRDFYEELLRRVYLSDLSELWFLENISYTRKPLYSLVKRVLDLIVGLVGFIVYILTYPIFALIIKLSSAGPVLFVQPRVGHLGKIFKVYKYRTMSGGRTDTWTEVNDPRVTRIGKFMRKSRLDELPQVINLILGNMSLVGPRPEQVHFVEKLKSEIPFYDERHVVKPGVTGWAQLNIYAGTLEETKVKLEYDLYYVKHRSILLDLEIFLKTIYYVFTWSGR